MRQWKSWEISAKTIISKNLRLHDRNKLFLLSGRSSFFFHRFSRQHIFAFGPLLKIQRQYKKAKSIYPRFYRQAQQKLAKEQRILSHRTKGSSRYEKQRIKVACLHEHVANQRKDFLHKTSRRLVTRFDCVVIEDLNMKGMSQALRFGKSVADNGWGMLTTFLHYKLGEQGKRLVKINKWFPSTKTCSSCGHRRDMPLSERTFSCACGFVSDRDWNAAINIRNEGWLLLGLS